MFFTNIPLNETINIAVELIFKHNPKFSRSKSDLKQLFIFATSQTHFLFNDNFCDQIDEVAMGSPLAPVLANLFMGCHEQSWLNNYEGPKVCITSVKSMTHYVCLKMQMMLWPFLIF